MRREPPKTEYAPLFPSHRLLHAVLLFFGSMVMYCTRGNISVAIICMVRDGVAQLNVTMDNGSDIANSSSSTVYSMAEQEGTSGGLDSSSGEFDWDKGTSSRLLAMYFYGYIFTQIPGGWLASKYGGKRVWGACMFVSAVCTLLTPVSARLNVNLASAVRFLLGFAAGVSCPCMHALLGRWSPPLERSKLTAISYAGPPAGNIATFAISGILCAYGFDNGWGSIFYLSGIFNFLWVVAWYLLAGDSPGKQTRISARERLYIEKSIGKGNVKKVEHIPWLAMATSGPLWGAMLAHMCNNWLNYTLLTSLPAFMKESLKFDIKQNGLLSSLPYVTQVIGTLVAGQLADALRYRRILSTKNTRKVFQCTSFAGIALCISVAGQLSYEHRYISVLLVCICTMFQSLNRGGYTANHLDLAPSYSGILFGITNTLATVPGMIAPVVAGILTPNRSSEEWRSVFYICAAVAVFGGVVYAILADGELQDWAVPKEANLELEIEAPLNYDKLDPGSKVKAIGYDDIDEVDCATVYAKLQDSSSEAK